MTDDEIKAFLAVYDKRTISERDMTAYEIASYQDAPDLALEVLRLREALRNLKGIAPEFDRAINEALEAK